MTRQFWNAFQNTIKLAETFFPVLWTSEQKRSEIYDSVHVAPAQVPELQKTVYSFAEFVDAVLYHPDWGYYIHNPNVIPGDYETYPQALSPFYGEQVAQRAFEAWRLLGKPGTASKPFRILEIGGGTGVLASDLLRSVEMRSSTDPEWRRFARTLEFRANDVSSTMLKRQATLMQQSGVRTSFVPVLGDIRLRATQERIGKISGFVIANELLDALGTHKILIRPSGQIETVYVMPTVSRTALSTLKAAGISPAFESEIEHGNGILRRRLGIDLPKQEFVLSRITFEKLLTLLHQATLKGVPDLFNAFKMREVYVPIQSNPDLARVLEREIPDLARAIVLGRPIWDGRGGEGIVLYIQAGLDALAEGLDSIVDEGYVVFIDYGDFIGTLIDSWRAGRFQLRLFPGDSVNPYRQITRRDITADVDFTAVTRSMEAAGFSLVFAGPQRSLASSAKKDASPSVSHPFVERFWQGGDHVSLLVFKKGVRTPDWAWGTTPLRDPYESKSLSPEERSEVEQFERRIRQSSGFDSHNKGKEGSPS